MLRYETVETCKRPDGSVYTIRVGGYLTEEDARESAGPEDRVQSYTLGWRD